MAKDDTLKVVFIDEKDGGDVPELTLDKTYHALNDDGQFVDIYDDNRKIGTYCVERFELASKIRRTRMVEFFQTGMGKRFYEATMPQIAVALQNIAAEMKRANDLKEQELKKDPQ